MGIWKNVRNLDSKFSWSFLGFLIGILGIGYAIYIENFKKDYKEISFEILSKTNVLDLNEKINDLAVTYKGENILTTNRSLKVLTVRVNSNGTKDVNQFDYDQNQEWGFSILEGEIVNNPEILSASNSYLQNSINSIRLDSLNRIVFPKVIIESNENFLVKVLIICDVGQNPDILPFGKIAGIKKFQVFQSERAVQELSFWQKLIYGGIGIHISRFIFYFLCLVLFLLVFGISASKISIFLEEKKKKKNIEKYRKNTTLEINENLDKVFEIYMNYQESFLRKAHRLISKKEILINALDLNEIQQKKLELIRDEDPELFEPYRREFVREAFETYPLNDFLIKKLKDYDVIRVSDEEGVSVNNEMVKAINDFVYFLKIQ